MNASSSGELETLELLLNPELGEELKRRREAHEEITSEKELFAPA